MSDSLNDAFNNLKKMMDSGNIPNEVQGLINNLSSMLQSGSSNKSNNLSSSQSSESSNNNLNIDPATLMKMTSLINNLNKKDNPGNNLLHSLKPYLRNSIYLILQK